MINVHSGPRVWDAMEPTLKSPGRKYAAVAYVGKRARELLHLGKDDVLIFDGSKGSIAQNHIELAEIEWFLDKGVRLFSRSGLHAKMIVADSDPPTAIVGSANASANSQDFLAEAVTVFDDPGAVLEVRNTILLWSAAAEEVDVEWLAWARSIPRKPRTSPERWKSDPHALLADPDKPLWLVKWHYGGEDVSDAVSIASGRAIKQHNADVYPISLDPAEGLDGMSEGDSVLTISQSPNRRVSPHSYVDEPGKIVEWLPGHDTILVAYRKDWKNVPWRTVKAK